jgi:hypothetical protein
MFALQKSGLCSLAADLNHNAKEMSDLKYMHAVEIFQEHLAAFEWRTYFIQRRSRQELLTVLACLCIQYKIMK